ncbi:hypothetical protein [Legionella jordanis]|uniref:Uncharacterized protein n=1 Tax=Legionella jordanis TaxID=456 RepID=A0A0W0VEI6_9GAMM|nr:hypothetical protein [Legionella jordanis]KTD18214.1 hypothetical protein Ljor_2520 [Legionella jordanis]RMX01173.1 hypothetical protein EAW55_11380 [Legionella jordanis]RMX21403.1 hypothetical protein EAS68_04345 [Legionella jordanis]VEH13693.1 Uncharacterised protein [Legionella jordanis]HAT8714596.1 hypothetical protein [Legionella jordanis]
MQAKVEAVGSYLTQATGNRVDFFNIGGLAKQRTRESLMGLWSHYSWRELFIRGGMLSFTFFCAWVAANSCEDEQCSSLERGAAGAAFGFVSSHLLAMGPTLWRRHRISIETDVIKGQVEVVLGVLNQKFNPESILFEDSIKLIASARRIAESISNLQLPVHKRGDAIQNLIKKKQLMRELYNSVEDLLNLDAVEIAVAKDKFEQTTTALGNLKEKLSVLVEAETPKPKNL